MDLRKLRYFAAIADAGSFTAASKLLGIAQPALSQHIKSLEGELGAQLLERGVKGVRLTHAGAAALDHVRVVLRDIERVHEAVDIRGVEIEGRVAIGLPTTVAEIFAGPFLREAFAQYPGISLHLVETHSGYLREWVDSGRVDLAMLFNVTAAAGLNVTPMLVEDIHLISGAGGRCVEYYVTVQECLALDLLMPSQPHGLRRMLDDRASVISGEGPRIRAEVDALPTLKRLVEEGLGHTLLPLAAVLREIEAGSLVARRVIDPSLERYLALVSRSSQPQTRAQQAIAKLALIVARHLIEIGVWPAKLVARAETDLLSTH